jgi:hypothetical protein
MKKIEPCNILWKFEANDYEIELPYGVGISPIFNVTYLYLLACFTGSICLSLMESIEAMMD